MAAGMSQKQINYHLRRLRAKYPDTEFQVLHASNGEVAIVPVRKMEKPAVQPTHNVQGRVLHYVDCDGEPIVAPGEIGMTTDEACRKGIKL